MLYECEFIAYLRHELYFFNANRFLAFCIFNKYDTPVWLTSGSSAFVVTTCVHTRVYYFVSCVLVYVHGSTV